MDLSINDATFFGFLTNLRSFACFRLFPVSSFILFMEKVLGLSINDVLNFKITIFIKNQENGKTPNFQLYVMLQMCTLVCASSSSITFFTLSFSSIKKLILRVIGWSFDKEVGSSNLDGVEARGVRWKISIHHIISFMDSPLCFYRMEEYCLELLYRNIWNYFVDSHR